jgi:hypothetical protein
MKTKFFSLVNRIKKFMSTGVSSEIEELTLALNDLRYISKVIEERSKTLETQLNDSFILMRATEERSRTLEVQLNDSLFLMRIMEARSRTLEYQANQSLYTATYQVNLLQKWYVESMQSNSLVIDAPSVVEAPSIRLETSHPIALMSNDHLVPDSTSEGLARPTAFVTHCMDVLGKDIRCLDLGVGAAGLVFEYVANGLTAVGIDGSDYCRKNRIGYWPVLPNNLYTCDITHPFCFKWPDGGRVSFDLITMWEVLEHILESDLGMLLKNVKEHLGKDGYFIGSISLIEYSDQSGIPYHVTLKKKSWWNDKFQENGMSIVDDQPFNINLFCRGNGPRFQDFHNYSKDPDSGFHFVAKLI